jgi:hypothetical protein
MASTICQVRVRLVQGQGSVDRSTLRLRFTRLLSGAELQPSALPPSAILMVRRLTDPLPGQLTVWEGTSRIDTSWERAAQSALSVLYHRAARPLWEPPAIHAEAVLFADEGEMLACLARDLSRGEASGRWWWRALLRTLPSSSSAGLTTLLCDKAASVPAALHHLAQYGQAVTVVNALSPQQALTVLSAMGRAYGMSDLLPIPSDKPDAVGSQSIQQKSGNQLSRDPIHIPSPYGFSLPVVTASQPPPMSSRMKEGDPQPVASPPWSAALVPPSLAKERACLLGVGLSLYERPAVIRSHAFLRSLRAWWTRQDIPPARQENGALLEKPDHTLPSERDELDPLSRATKEGIKVPADGTLMETLSPQVSHRAFSETKTAREQTFHQDKEPPARTENQDRVELRAPLEVETGKTQQETGNPAENDRILIPGETRTEPGKFHRQKEQVREEQQVETDQEHTVPLVKKSAILSLEDGIPTQLGGVLYLVNLMRHLDLPACFEEEWGLGSNIGAWGILEALGRGLLNQESAHLGADPLWEALARLDGREPGELPGATFPGSDRFHLPVRWVIPVENDGENRFSWGTDQQRLCLWSERGYVLVDCPRDAFAPDTQAQQALQAYTETARDGVMWALEWKPLQQAPIDPLARPLLGGLNPHLAHWLAFVLPYIRLRLRRALARGATEEVDIETVLLRQQGWLYVTSTHVDLVLRLDDVSLPVRLAGLDCNPGWLTEFGRVVLFHFA